MHPSVDLCEVCVFCIYKSMCPPIGMNTICVCLNAYFCAMLCVCLQGGDGGRKKGLDYVP